MLRFSPACCVTVAAGQERKRPETFFFFSLAPWHVQFPVGYWDLSQKDRTWAAWKTKKNQSCIQEEKVKKSLSPTCTWYAMGRWWLDLHQRLLLKWDMCEEGDEQCSIIFVSENPQRPTQKGFFKTNFGWNLNEKESGGFYMFGFFIESISAWRIVTVETFFTCSFLLLHLSHSIRSN